VKARIDAFVREIEAPNWSKLSEVLGARTSAHFVAAQRIGKALKKS